MIPEDIPLLNPIPLVVNRSKQREVPRTDSQMTVSDDEIVIISERKGKPLPSRRSGRVASGSVSGSESVKITERKKKAEPKQKRKEASQSDHKDPSTKKRHDVNAGEDNELLTYMMKKAKSDGKDAERTKQRNKESSRGVDPSAEKKQKFEKKKSTKKGKKEDVILESDSENEGISQLKRENGVWWLGTGANRRRDEIEEEAANGEMNEGENREEKKENERSVEENFEWEQVQTEAAVEGEQLAKATGSEIVKEFLNVVDEERTIDEGVTTPAALPVK
ncbi:hypothetical protein Dimus_010504 [Dionaea muscipula]